MRHEKQEAALLHRSRRFPCTQENICDFTTLKQPLFKFVKLELDRQAAESAELHRDFVGLAAVAVLASAVLESVEGEAVDSVEE